MHPDPDLDLLQRMRVVVDPFAPYSGLGRLSYGAAQDHCCHADLVSMLENLVVFEAGTSARSLQTGRGFPDIQPPLDLSFCHQPLAISAPVDLSALICCQSVACMVSPLYSGVHSKGGDRVLHNDFSVHS